MEPSRKASKKPPSPSEVLASQLPGWRAFRNLSVQQLADRVAQMGGHLGRVSITKIENHQRGISLDEALTLAAALNVPPPLLFFPMKTGDHVRITSISEIHPDLALRWLSGEGPLAVTDRRAMNLAEWSEAKWTEAAKPLRLYDAHREAQRLGHFAQTAIQRSQVAKDRQGAREAGYRFADRLRTLADVRRDMRLLGMTPPKLHPTWSTELKRLGEEG
jgi:transcriptional regulator with XRE-family HTH domain